jgi:hypothetical protein
MTSVLTLEIRLSGWRTGEPGWSAQIEVPGRLTLSELHDTIQRLVDFDDDHLHEFFAGRNWRDRKVTFGEASGSPFELNEGEEVPLEDVFPLPKGQKLFYHFDFGDDWIFQVKCNPRITQANQLERPKLIQERGERPVQYPSEDGEG